MTRTSEYGSPFRNKDSGVDETKDKVNIQRLNTGFKNFVAQNKGNFDTSAADSIPVKYGMYYGPAAGYIFGKFFCDAFTSPKSRYVPKMIKLLCVGFGYKYAVNTQGRANFITTCKNFANFPTDVQNALMTGDSRFLRTYWKTEQ